MLLTSTTDNVQVIIGATGVNPLHIISSYNDTTSTGVTPTKTVTTIGATGGTGPVNIMPAPSSGHQRSLRFASIFNADSVAVAVTIRTNYNSTTRIVLNTTLQVNEYIQYTHRTGWKVFDMNGSLKNYTGFYDMTDCSYNSIVLSSANATNTALTNTGICLYLGKATGAYSTVIVEHYIGSTSGASITWAELAIYKGTPQIGANTTATRVGYADMQALWLSQVNIYRFTGISVSNVQAGDDLWVVFAASAVTFPTFRTHNVADNIGAGFIGTLPASTRPSTSSSVTISPSTSVLQPWIVWNGI